MARRLFVWSAILSLFFDQVTKVLAYGLLGRRGYEPARRWIEGRQAGKPVSPLDEVVDGLT